MTTLIINTYSACGPRALSFPRESINIWLAAANDMNIFALNLKLKNLNL